VRDTNIEHDFYTRLFDVHHRVCCAPWYVRLLLRLIKCKYLAFIQSWLLDILLAMLDRDFKHGKLYQLDIS